MERPKNIGGYRYRKSRDIPVPVPLPVLENLQRSGKTSTGTVQVSSTGIVSVLAADNFILSLLNDRYSANFWVDFPGKNPGPKKLIVLLQNTMLMFCFYGTGTVTVIYFEKDKLP